MRKAPGWFTRETGSVPRTLRGAADSAHVLQPHGLPQLRRGVALPAGAAPAHRRQLPAGAGAVVLPAAAAHRAAPLPQHALLRHLTSHLGITLCPAKYCR